jgi:DNA-binding PadR family transcriptional regulator
MKNPVESLLPLAPAVLHILVALAREDLHGYGIMQEVACQSEGQYKLGPGTLYDNLQRLVKQGLVEETGKEPEDSRRRYYRLSSSGRHVLSGEISRLESVIREARLHIRAPQTGRA